ncbi:LppM family (lipo)protein [Actinomyces wuliandei]|uniref:LppM family (lipo)protein n=1 Tax=Actinomyces wuliandei TaxID=2057743 RepID=UPI000FD94C97|nr:hypothetical protein [Actinomyces wuliandei]
MTRRSPMRLRYAAASLLAPAALLLAACDAHITMTIDGDTDTVRSSVVVWDSALSETDCSAEGMSDMLGATTPLPDTAEETTFTWTDHQGQPACQITSADVPLDEMDGSTTVSHEEGSYVVELDRGTTSRETIESFYGPMDVSLTITFPGEVTEASGNAEIDGSSVTWPDVLEEEGTLHARAEDSSFSPLPWVALGGAALLVVVGAVTASVLLRRRRRHQATSASPEPPTTGTAPSAQPGPPPLQQPAASQDQQPPAQPQQPHQHTGQE